MLGLSRNLVPRLAKNFAINRAPLSVSAACSANVGPNYEVGPYPRTKEERERAAKKYNLIPEDYEPYDEGEGWGDYPKLKAIGAFNRDWYDDFDDPEDLRFYGEVFHLHADLYYWERIDPLRKEKYAMLTDWQQFLVFLGVAGAVPTLCYLFRYFKIELNHPWKKRYFAAPDTVYYHFPSTDSHHHH